MATLFYEISIIERRAIADAERVGGVRGLSTVSCRPTVMARSPRMRACARRPGRTEPAMVPGPARGELEGRTSDVGVEGASIPVELRPDIGRGVHEVSSARAPVAGRSAQELADEGRYVNVFDQSQARPLEQLGRLAGRE